MPSSSPGLSRKSGREGFPTVVREARALGVPVISADLPALRALAHADRDLRLVPRASGAGLAGLLAANPRQQLDEVAGFGRAVELWQQDLVERQLDRARRAGEQENQGTLA